MGRLYFIPVTLVLFLLALDRRWWVLLGLSLPVLVGGVYTWVHFRDFQESYLAIYRAGPKPLRIHYPLKPLEDTRRRVQIGDFPEARYVLEARTGRLVLVAR